MLFNSYTFILFFLTVLATQKFLANWTLKKTILLFSSYFFYAAWNPPFVILLWISTLADWWISKRIYRNRKIAIRRFFLGISIAVNLGLLGFFKYANFLLENFISLLSIFDIHYSPLPLDVVLPVGISFYTFQTLSYTFDVYNRKGRPWHSFLDYALYVSFFPQLVAGPIVRAFEFLPQCLKPQRVQVEQMSIGLSLLVVGLFEKVIIADGLLAPVVEAVYINGSVPDFTSAWCGTIAFSGQIFCDFAGYSTCAIGIGRCLGFRLPDNFRSPYSAIGFRDFWRRWHISLSTWLRDYLYIWPAGGNRKGTIRTHFNILLTMLVGGLWHGASWTFIAWGGIHGVFLVAERILVNGFFKKHVIDSFLLNAAVKTLSWFFTYIGVCFAWVFFRADNFPQAWRIIKAMVGTTQAASGAKLQQADIHIVFWIMGLMLLVQWVLRNRNLKEIVKNSPWWIRSAAIAAMLVAIATLSGEDRAFIYFQF